MSLCKILKTKILVENVGAAPHPHPQSANFFARATRIGKKMSLKLKPPGRLADFIIQKIFEVRREPAGRVPIG